MKKIQRYLYKTALSHNTALLQLILTEGHQTMNINLYKFCCITTLLNSDKFFKIH